MQLNLTLDQTITVASLVVGGAVSLWMRSVSAQNKLFDSKMNVLQKDIHDLKRTDNGLEKSLDELRSAVQDTRENYVTTLRFEKFVDLVNVKIDSIMSRFDLIIEKLDKKPDKDDCKEHCKR